MAHELTDRAVIAVSGPEARPFLQKLVTNDVETVAADRPAYAALLTPQGKIRFDFLVTAQGESLLLDCPKTGAEALRRQLTLYRLRTKVDIAPRDDLHVILGDGPHDPRLEALGRRTVAAMPAEDGTAAYHAHRVALGVPEGADFGDEAMFAMDAGLDELHALSFAKGCYVGQELTARMKHRGKDLKRLLPVTAEALALGDTVTRGGTHIGTVMSSYGRCGFALVRLDLVGDASDVEIAGAAAKIARPAWLSS